MSYETRVDELDDKTCPKCQYPMVKTNGNFESTHDWRPIWKCTKCGKRLKRVSESHIEDIACLIGESPEETTKSEKGSQLSSAIALDVVTIMRDELAKLGCRLTDYYINFTTKGFDVTNVKIECDDQERVIEALKAADPSVRHEFTESPTKYAYMAANVEVSRRVNDELGLDYQAFGFDKSDNVSISVNEPEEEKPLPPEPDILPQEIISGVEELPEPDQTPDLGIEEPLELPKDEFEELPEYQEGEPPAETEEEPTEEAGIPPEERKPGREF